MKCKFSNKKCQTDYFKLGNWILTIGQIFVNDFDMIPVNARAGIYQQGFADVQREHNRKGQKETLVLHL